MQKVAYFIISDGVGGAEQIVWQTLSGFSDKTGFFLITNNEMFAYYKNILPANNILNIGDIYLHTQKKFRYLRYLLNNRFYNTRNFLVKQKTKKIRAFLNKNNIRIIHAHLDYAILSALDIKKYEPATSLIYTVHGAFGLIEDKSFRPDIAIKKIDFKNINCLVFVASYLHQVYLKAGIAVNRYQVIYNGLEKNVFNKLSEKKKENHFRILFVGGSKPVKGYDLLVETVKKLIVQKLFFKVTVLGPLEPGCDLLKLIKDNSLENYFELIGFVSPPAHLNYFRNNDVLLMPSRSEAMPMAAIEAVFCDLPVVASRVGGLPEIIKHGENGYLCDLDAMQFCEHIMAIANDYDVFISKTISNNKAARLLFDLDNIRHELLDLYKNAMTHE